jgi:Protein of unknown function (DUF2881).
MNDTLKDVMGVMLAVIGLATITVLVRQGSQTAGIISSSTSGFANVLKQAMG